MRHVNAPLTQFGITPAGYQVLRGRRPLLLPASAKLFPDHEWQVRVVNVSVGGVGCECESLPRVGSQIILQVEQLGQVPALVRWTSLGSFGVRFNGKIDVSEKQTIAKLLSMSREVSLIGTEGPRPTPSSPDPDPERYRLGWEFEIERLRDFQLDLLAQLQILTAYPKPDQGALADLRFKVLRATGERRDVLQTRVFPELEKRSSSRIVTTIARFRAKDEAFRSQLTQHLGNWPMPAIVSDWAGYCAASAKMQACARLQIAAEEEVLALWRNPGF